MNGVLFVDKKINMTSRDVVNQLVKIFHTKKIGHTGTLDPLASGVLIVTIGTYTKLGELLTSYDKEYVATMKLGIKTDTGDITGKVIEENGKKVSLTKIKETFQTFPKEYMQTVPIYSAVKIHGKKLYEYAREGIDVELPKRKVEIKELELLNIKDNEIQFRVVVSKGTYIRSLIEDIGESMGTIGTMSALERTRQGNVSIKECYSLDDIHENTKLKTIDDLFHYPKYELNDEQYKRVCNGNALKLDSRENRILLCYQHNTIAIYESVNQEYKMVFKCV